MCSAAIPRQKLTFVWEETDIDEIRSFYCHNSSTSVTLQDAAGIRTSQCLFVLNYYSEDKSASL